jgi:translocation and assembly module TamB
MKWALRMVALIALLVLVLGGTVGWLVGTESGLRWAMQFAQRTIGGKLQLNNPRGALAGTMRFDRIAYMLDSTTIEAFGVEIRTDAIALRKRTLALERLHSDRVVVRLSSAPSAEPASKPALPTTLALPLAVRIDAATVGAIEVVRDGATTRVRDLYLSYKGSGSEHRLQSLRANTEFGYVGAAGSVATTRPYKLDFGLALLRLGTDAAANKAPVGAMDLPANLRVHLSGSMREPTAIAHAQLAQAQASIRARLAPFDRDWPQLLQSLDLDASDIDLAKLAPGLPQTALMLQATAHGGTFQLEGNLALRNAQAGPFDRQRVPVASLETHFTTDLASAAFAQLKVDFAAGGALSGTGEMHREPLSGRVDLTASRIDLRAFASNLRATSLAGPLRAVVEGPQQQTVSATLTEADITLGAHAQRNGDVIDVTDMQLAARGSAATGKGRVVLGTPTQFNAAVTFNRFDPARFGNFPAGSINGSTDVKGRLGEPRQLDAAWIIAKSTLRGQPLASRGRAHLSGNRVASIDGSARLGSNEVSVRGAYGAPTDRLQWRLDAPQLAQLARELSGQVQATGTVSGAGNQMQATVTADAQGLRLPAGLSVQSLHVEAHAGMQSTAPLAIKLVAQQAVVPQVTLDKLTLDTTGTRAQHEAALQAVAQQRTFELRARGGWSGTWPGKWAGELETARLRGVLPGDAIVRLAAPASIAAASENVTVRSLALKVTSNNAPEAEFRLADLIWEPGRFSSSGEFERLSTRWLAAFLSLPPGVETSVSFAGNWSVRAQPRLSGTISIRRDQGDIRLAGPPSIEAGLSQATLEMRFDDGRIAAQLDVGAKLAQVKANATLDPAPGAAGIGVTANSPLAVTAQLDIAEMRLITEPLLTVARVSGRVAANLRGSGTLGAPRIEGTLAADSLDITAPPYGVQLTDGRVRAQLQTDSVTVTELAIRGGDGHFTASGTVPLRAEGGRAQLDWRAERFRLLNRPDMRLVLSGNGNAGFADGKFALRGALHADQGHFELARQQLPQPGDDVVVFGRAAPPARKQARAPLDLDLQLDLGKELSLQGFGLNGKVTGNLHLTTSTEGELRAAGRVQTIDAIFRAYGQQLVVDPGVLVFDGPIDNPALEITAWRRNQQVEAGVQLSGTAKAPLVTLVSEPQVPEGDRLSWLVLGRAPGDAEGADLALLQAAAGALLGGGDSMPMTQKVARSLGLDELAVRSSKEIASNVVAVGKRLSDKFLVTYEYGLGAAAEHLVKLDYALTRRISLRAETGSTTGFGVIYRLSWD